MRILPVAAAVAVAFLFSAAPSGAQSLSELAAKEKERRSKAKAGKSYTEQDLGRGGSSVAVSDTGAAASDPKAAPAAGDAAKTDPAKKEKTEDELRAEREAAWREKVVKATAEVGRLQARADALQTALNDLTQNLYGSTRQTQAAELEQVQSQLAAARKNVEDLQEEGRRSSYR